MQDLIDRWEELKKALSHKAAVASSDVPQPKSDVPTEVHPDHLPKVKYGKKSIPGGMSDPFTDDDSMGHTTIGGKTYVVRHGARAQRTDAEHQMSKLLGADHMLPHQSYDHGLNHPDYHLEEGFDPSKHGGTSLQEHAGDDSIHSAVEDDKLSKGMRDQWKNGDLHKLWALHYISNNADMHPGNFVYDKDGQIKAFDSDQAYYELPSGHVVEKGEGEDHLKYMPNAMGQLPSYLAPFVEHQHDYEDDLPPKFQKDQVSVKALNEHAKNINPDLFEQFGPHAAERAAKAKKALMSADPTGEMMKLWNDHSDKTGDLTWEKNEKKAAAKKKKRAA